ncbi:MAG: peptidase M28, partial [Candidatus Aminicenantes bacterium]|nr:peptidase M28 [Candidatus Aminicenantes bacterium]
MKPVTRVIAAASLALAIGAFASDQGPAVDWDMAARIREEGLQRSQVMDIVGYIVDVLGARLTNSEDMKRAQAWVK